VNLHVIVYQYGKVASTSLVTSLNELPDVVAHQCHFFGEEAFRTTVKQLCNPNTNDYFFEHSLGQLVENLKAYRLYHQQNRPQGHRCIVLTVAREPFDWFSSLLTQEIEGHIPALTLSLRDQGGDSMTTEQIVTHGLSLLIERIHGALDSVDGNIDELTPNKRRLLDQILPFIDSQDFEAFLFILGRFLLPHWWFRSQFTPEFGVAIGDMADRGKGLLSASAKTGDVYLARYEQLDTAFKRLLELENLPCRALVRVNEGRNKAFSNEINAVFQTQRAIDLRSRSQSDTTRALGYA